MAFENLLISQYYLAHYSCFSTNSLSTRIYCNALWSLNSKLFIGQIFFRVHGVRLSYNTWAVGYMTLGDPWLDEAMSAAGPKSEALKGEPIVSSKSFQYAATDDVPHCVYCPLQKNRRIYSKVAVVLFSMFNISFVC